MTVGVAALGVWLAWPLPDGLLTPPLVSSLTLQDRNGLELRRVRASGGERRVWVPLGDFDPKIIQAFVAVEDRRFYDHVGIDPRALARSFVLDLRRRRIVSGGSTITMQLARILGVAGRGWPGKLEQALWALRLERHLTKQEILEQYLNRVPLGQGTAGVPAAAALYFSTSASRLSLGQAALLAGLASAPSGDNPFVAPDRARDARLLALRRMGALGFATGDGVARAVGEPVMVRTPTPFLAPHFTSRVLEWAEDSGVALAGTWRTSIDLPLQTTLEAEVRHTVDQLQDQGVRQAAVVVLDNRTGEILAWVGSPDFWSDTAGQVDMVVSQRQPGSALKPFLYGLAFDRGVTPATILADIPHTYQTSTGPYQPRNYDRHFHGPVRAREALASSFNVPAVELTNRVGVGSLLRTLRVAGLASLDHSAEYYGLGLALGNGDVDLLDLANAYRALAQEGTWEPFRWTVADAGGGSRAPGSGPRVVSAGAAALVLDILADPVARVPGFGIETPFDFSFPVAVKTGTSHHYTDNWAVGVTGGFTVAVWAGNFSGRPMNDVSGVTGAGPLLHRAVLDVARIRDPGVLPSPAAAGARAATICRLSGMLATPNCPPVEEWFLPGTAPTATDDWQGPGGTIVWPAEYAAWAEQTGRREESGPTSDSTLAPPRSAAFAIISPRDGDRYQIPPGMDPRYATIPLRVSGSAADGIVRWSVDGRGIRATRWPLQLGAHTVRAIAASGRSAEVRIEVH